MTTTVKATKGYKGIGMEGAIATWYARITAKNMEDFRSDARKVASHVSDGAAILEVAPGPGYLLLELAKLGTYKLTGLDISAKFVEIAQENTRKAGVAIDFQRGDAAHMPFNDGMYNFIVCRAAFKNFSEPVMALNEMHRVLKPGGKALILDLRGDASLKDINEAADNMGLTGFNKFMTKLVFRTTLIKRAYTRESFNQLVVQSKFRQCKIVEDKIGLEVWLEKAAH